MSWHSNLSQFYAYVVSYETVKKCNDDFAQRKLYVGLGVSLMFSTGFFSMNTNGKHIIYSSGDIEKSKEGMCT